MTANLFDDRKATVNGKTRQARKCDTLQSKLVRHLRDKGSITEPEYRDLLGGRSVSAALHNVRLAGMLTRGVEFIERLKEYDAKGVPEMRYHLRTIQTHEPTKVEEVVPEPVAEVTSEPAPEIIAREPEPNFIQLVSIDPVGGDASLRVVMADGTIHKKLLSMRERRFIMAALSAFD